MLFILIRHAKSSWEHDLEDHDRPLSNRGVNDAKLVFKELKSLLPNRFDIWCSTSNRTRQTLNIFASVSCINNNQIQFKSGLFTFNSRDLEKELIKNKADNLIIFGHNNAITDFVNKFGDYYIEKIPTCGVVILKFDDSNDFTSNKGVIIKTIFPRDFK